MRHKTAKSH